MAQDVAVSESHVLALIKKAATPADRAHLARASMERVRDDRFAKEVPRFLTELPFGDDDDAISDRIAAAVLVAEDPDAQQSEAGTTAATKLVGKTITVHDLRVRDGDRPGGWGAYLLLDVTVGDTDEHVVVNTGAKQVVTRLARAWAEGQLPVSGVICELAGTGRRGNPALAFIVENGF